MSSEKTEAAEAKPKKGKGLIIKLVGALVLLGVGGGGVFGLMQAGILGGGNGKQEKVDNNPKLIRKGEEDPYAPTTDGKEGEGGPAVEGEGGSKYRTAYYSFTDEFTSNLRNSDSLVQISLAASTRRDGRVLMWLAEHELAIRSRILVALADTPEEDIYSPEGKERLQKRLTKAVNEVLIEQEGFGGVDAVHFRTFIVQ